MSGESPSSTETVTGFEKRKAEHIEHALSGASQSNVMRGFDAIHMLHEALPDLDFSEINLEDSDPKALFTSPFFVASMTAGHRDGEAINQRIAEACNHTGWAMGVGSQRRELFDADEAKRWQEINKKNSNVIFLSNLGLSQVIQTPVDKIKKIIESLGAKALIVHTNPLQEALQVEGTPQFKGGVKALETLCRDLDCPVILKETGCGFSKHTLKTVSQIGLFAVDVSGSGGTHWGRVEGMRAKEQSPQQIAAEAFANWGISTVDSLLYASNVKAEFRLWASGGLRNGLDAAKCFALGAKKVSFAKKVLEPAMLSSQAVVDFMHQSEYELKVAMFCTGSKNFSKLQQVTNIANYQNLIRDMHV